MNRPCAIQIDCPGSDFPVLNLSAEAPDPNRNYCLFFPSIPGDGEPLNVSLWLDCGLRVCDQGSEPSTCLIPLPHCFDTISSVCKRPPPPPPPPCCDPPPPPPPQPPQTFTNHEQTCSVCCADCSTWSYTVPAGSVSDYTQAGADQKAHAKACALARNTRQCPGTPLTVLPGATKDQSYIDALTGGCGLAIDWSVYSGSLPPGLTINRATGVISGTPTATGNYNFQLLVTTI